jgi:hypothetical protein
VRASRTKPSERGQSMVELALTLPFLVLLFVGVVEVAFLTRTYLAVLEASREGARLGARGSANFDNNEIRTLVEQDLARQGYTTANGLVDIIIVRANVGPGKVVNTYDVYSMLGSGRPVKMTKSVLLARLQPSDPQGRLIVVEICLDHHLLLGFPGISAIIPNPLSLQPYSVMRMLQ